MIAVHVDVAQPGDADVTHANDPGPRCGERYRRTYVCTRRPHATGQHVSGTGVVVIAVWEDYGEMRECWCPITGGERVLDVDCPSHGNPLVEYDGYVDPLEVHDAAHDPDPYDQDDDRRFDR